jgi:hypothetical protein
MIGYPKEIDETITTSIVKSTWLHMQFVLIFVTVPSQSGTHLLALTVKPVILKPLKESTSSILHNLLPQNCTNVITGGQ